MDAKFGSSGIRGPFGGLVTPELALALGRAVGTDHKNVIIGRDARLTGPLLEAAFVAGLASVGAEVTRAGVLPTPALAHAAAAYDAGVVITASHNPAPDNGFKLWKPDGAAFDAAARARVEALLRETPATAAWNAVGGIHEDLGASERHTQRILDLVGTLPRRLKVVLDCGNGAASRQSPDLLRRLGCDVITLNAQPDGAFPGRPSEPNEENLAALRQAVVATGADLGIAHDGDADRCMAVTHTGRFVGGDELLVLFAREHAGKSIVCPVDVSRMVDDATGCRVSRTRVGDAFVSERIAADQAAWGGEASGAWIFPELSYCPDGPHAAARLCRIVAGSTETLNGMVEALPQYPLWRHAWKLTAPEMASTMTRFREGLADGKVNDLDGIRVDYDDGWVLVRPSGTEPKVRVTIEAVDAASLERLRLKVLNLAPPS